MSLEDPYEGQKFTSFDVLKKYLEEYGQRNFVKFWIRSSHTISSVKSKNAKKMNPDLKYVCMKFACIFGGEKIRCRGSGIRKSTTYRNLGCPCMINAVVGEDGNHVKLETVVLEHNHALCKSLYDSLKKSKNKMRILQDDAKLNRSSLLKKRKVAVSEDAESAETIVCDGGRDAAEDEAGQPRSEGKGDEPLDDGPRENGSAVTGEDNFQEYLKTMKEKYGNNFKIIVVDREPTEHAGTGPTGDNESNDEDAKSEAASAEEKPPDPIRETDHPANEFEYWTSSSEKDICRLCLSTSSKLTPIFKPSLPLESTILSFKIMSCASIEVSNDDELPSSICAACEEILDIAYNFRMRCENSDSILRKAYLSNRFITDVSSLSNECTYSEENATDCKPEESFKAISSQDNEGNCRDVLKNEKETFPELNGDAAGVVGSGSEMYEKYDEACPICGTAFADYADLLHHLKEHADVENFLLTCNLCSVVFTNVKSLLDHMDEHIIDVKGDWTEQLIDCSRCELSFLTVEDARLHTETHAPSKEQHSSRPETPSDKAPNSASGYLCNICGKILKSKDRFQSHRNTHEGLRPHICLKCGRGFADRKNMHQHYDIVHLRKAKHECPICHKKFYAPTKMKSHITMHYGVKPFSCDVCNKTFRLRMNMIKHKKTHSNERPHKCDKCSAAFIDKNLLTRHSYVHGGERPHVCPYCGHRFTVKFNLKKHIVSGKCSGKSRNLKPVAGGELDARGWAPLSESRPEANLDGSECALKGDPAATDFSHHHCESVEMDILPQYQVK